MPSGEIGRRTARRARAPGPATRIVLGLAMLGLVTHGLGGCSAGDVQFEGKLFELAGLNNVGQRSAAPEISERTGLVVPPDLNRLPDPNQPAAINTADTALASINDPDLAKNQDQGELARQQDEACGQRYELAKMRGDIDAEQMSGPLGPCRKSVLSSVGQWMNSK